MKEKKRKKYEPTDEMTGKQKYKREAYDWTLTVCQALFAVIVVFTFFFRSVTVQGDSMCHTLESGDRLIVSGINYTPERGDIVVIHDPSEKNFSGPVIKRVIATEGETVIIDYYKKTISIQTADSKTIQLYEPYVNRGRCRVRIGAGDIVYDECKHSWPDPAYSYADTSIKHLERHTVAKGHVFVCGDNRAHSLDSRYVGDIDVRQILGKAVWRILPLSGFGLLPHAEY